MTPTDQPDTAGAYGPGSDQPARRSVRPADVAPDFTAMAYVQGAFREISLSDFPGKWIVLYFYPGDFTFVCPTELASVAERTKDLESLDVQFLSASTDSHFAHKMWDEVELSKMVDGGIPFPMIADAGGRIGREYGVYDEEAGVHMRGRFLIDPDGVVQAVEMLNHAVARNVNELIRQVRAFRRVRSAQEVIPAGWQPDRPALKPSPELSGRVWKTWKPPGATGSLSSSDE